MTTTYVVNLQAAIWVDEKPPVRLFSKKIELPFPPTVGLSISLEVDGSGDERLGPACFQCEAVDYNLLAGEFDAHSGIEGEVADPRLVEPSVARLLSAGFAEIDDNPGKPRLRVVRSKN